MNKLKLPPDLNGLFLPLRDNKAFVIGQLGQSLDGKIATETGDSKYISGKDGLLHLHRLRSFSEAVVVGVGTVLADNPQLNLRLCGGSDPARVIIDPRGRLPPDALVLRNDGTRCIVITTRYSSINFAKIEFASHVERIELDAVEDSISPLKIIEVLGELGFHKLLIEGGAHTISKFLSDNALDRLHITVSPIIIGSGKSGLNLSPIGFLSEALRPKTQSYLIGKDVVFDCNFRDC